MIRTGNTSFVVVAVLILSACDPLVIASRSDPEPTGGREPATAEASAAALASDNSEWPANRIAFVGDSLLLQAEVPGKIRPYREQGDPAFLTDVAHSQSWNASVHALSGYPIQLLRPSISAFISQGADVVVVAGGVNDVRIAVERGDPTSLAYSRLQIRDAVAQLAAAPCGVLVTMHTDSPLWDMRTDGPVLNAEMVTQAAAHENVHTYDWAALVVQQGQNWMRADGVHLTTAGEEAYRNAMLDAAALCRPVNGPSRAAYEADQSTAMRSTTKTSVSFGPMAPAAPALP